LKPLKTIQLKENYRIGDILDSLLALSLIITCLQVEANVGTRRKLLMGYNLAVDFVVGLVPLLGDFFDGSFKCNTRNVRILEECLDEAYMPAHQKEKIARDKKALVAKLDKKNTKKQDKKSQVKQHFPPAAVLEELDDGENLLPIHEPTSEPKRPEPARTSPKNSSPPVNESNRKTRSSSRIWR
jgi:hypothetical protein